MFVMLAVIQYVIMMDIALNAAQGLLAHIFIMGKIAVPIKNQRNQYSKAFYRERIAGTKFYYGKEFDN